MRIQEVIARRHELHVRDFERPFDGVVDDNQDVHGERRRNARSGVRWLGIVANVAASVAHLAIQCKAITGVFRRGFVERTRAFRAT